ncbi:hypothetical protein LX36DRAFT_609790, partial [Colletotrichum falcatum]
AWPYTYLAHPAAPRQHTSTPGIRGHLYITARGCCFCHLFLPSAFSSSVTRACLVHFPTYRNEAKTLFDDKFTSE